MQLQRHKEAFESQGVEVVLISFGPEERARSWQIETGVYYPLLLDPDRLVYKAYETERSFILSWSLKTIWGYYQLMREGRKWRGIQGDSIQLGGDFIIDPEGVIRMAYYSKNPMDRPPVEDLLSAVKQLNI